MRKKLSKEIKPEDSIINSINLQKTKKTIYFKNLTTISESERESLTTEIKRQKKYIEDHLSD